MAKTRNARRRKRKKEKTQGANFSSTLPNDILQNILLLVGEGSYRSIGMVNKRFREAYLRHHAKITHLSVAASHPSLGELYLEDHKGNVEVRKLCFEAAKLGQNKVLNLPPVYRLWTAETRATASGTMERAAEFGHESTVQFLHLNGCDFTRRTCALAARGGHLLLLQWLRAAGCPWDSRTCNEAARGGHLKVLQWARAKGCEWYGWTIHAAAHNHHWDVVLWALSNGCFVSDNTSDFITRNLPSTALTSRQTEEN